MRGAYPTPYNQPRRKPNRMARIYPFRALRYDTQKVRMEDVVTQPYDKITPAMQQVYYDRSKYNLIRVVLGKREPTDTDAFAPETDPATPQHNVYTRAAESLTSWRKKAILREEAVPALYGYSQEYTVPDTTTVQTRRGFIALGHLYDYADHIVYRHEQTFPKHKSDRLALFKATRTYCEQIYMLYSDPAFTAEQLIFESAGDAGELAKPADLEIRDEYDVLHRVWKLTDPRLINLIVTAMQDKKLIIADGHHRYETSVAYMHERAAELNLPSKLGAPDQASETWDPTSAVSEDESPSNLADESHSLFPEPAFPEAAMMMTFVNMDAPGITILPTHRVVFGLENFSPSDFIGKVSEYFSVELLKVDQTHAGSVALQTPEEQERHQQSFVTIALADLKKTAGTAFVLKTDAGYHLLRPKPEAIAEKLYQLYPEMTRRQAQLDVVQLHRILLEHLLGLTHESIANTENIRYLRDAAEAVAQVDTGQANLAFLIKPVTLDQLRDISLSGDVMPQKSTDFYPKLLSGLALYALD